MRLSRKEKNSYGTCEYCEQVGKLTRDHILPRAAKRKRFYGHGIEFDPIRMQGLITRPENYADVCFSCNGEKADSTPNAWLSFCPEKAVPFMKNWLKREGYEYYVIAKALKDRECLPHNIRHRRS